MKLRVLLISLLTSIILVNSCVHDPFLVPDPPIVVNQQNPGGYSGQACIYQGVCFESTILPIFISSCAKSGCHDATTRMADRVLDSYANILRGGISVGNHSRSKLYTVLFATGGDQMPPRPDTQLSQAKKDSIAKWIDQGAKNTVKCNCSCDTTQFKYAAIILPIMQNYCVGCHNPNSLGGNINLSIYTGTKAIALNGKLMGSITHAPTFSAMPKGGKLSDCQIKQINKWVNAGALNN